MKIDTSTFSKVVVFIGGGGYVGSAFLKETSKLGKNLYVIVSPNASLSLPNVISIRANMTKEREKTIRRIIDLTGRIDVLVHAAATYAFETADSLSEKNMKREFEVNTLLPLLVTQEVYRQHWSLFSKEENEKKRHAVIVIGSQAGEGKTSRPELITYSATKAALKVAWEYYGDFLESKGIRSVVLKPGSLKENDNLSRFLTHLKAEIA